MSVLILAILAAAAPIKSDLTAVSKKLIQDMVGDKLLDGESARYRWPELPKNHSVTYCAFVNAKNRYGAYTGFEPFLVMGATSHGGPHKGSFTPSEIMLSSDFDGADKFIAKECAEANIDISVLPPASN